MLRKIYLLIILMLTASASHADISKHQVRSEQNPTLEQYKQKPNLFLKIQQYDIPLIKEKFNQEIQAIIEAADLLQSNTFIFRHSWDMEKTAKPYTFANEINWQAQPWDDPEWTFMLNRHHYWLDLGRAYLFTGDEKYAQTFAKQLEHWIDKNPLNDTMKSSSWRRIEAGFRAENWIKAFEYFKNSPVMTPKLLKKMITSLNQHAHYLNSQYSRFSKTSNWGVIEFTGLFYLSLFLDDNSMAASWSKSAVEKLDKMIQLQVLDDGSHWEQSPMYHNHVFQSYMNVILTAKRMKYSLSHTIYERTLLMAKANIQWQKPNYHQPLLGDSDDTDIRDILTFATLVFNNQVIKSRAFININLESYLVFGREGEKRFEELTAISPNYHSVYMESSGDLYMRNTWEESASFASLHLKKLGGGHGHDNIFHFNLFAHQRDYLVDSGRYTYVDGPWRDYFKSSQSHNGIEVDNEHNSIYQSSWTNSFEARSQGIYTKLTGSYDYAEAENTAYLRLPSPVLAKRRMLFLKPATWLLIDSFSSNSVHTYQQNFNFPNTLVEQKNNTVLTTYENVDLNITPLKPVNISLKDSWYSPEYNTKVIAKRAELSIKNEGFTSLITLLHFTQAQKLLAKLIPVYTLKGNKVSSTDAEAIQISDQKKVYTLIVVHNSSAPATPFLVVNGIVIRGEVVLITRNETSMTTEIIKD